MLATIGDARLVELPIGATEDRVIGSLDLQKILRDGEHAFSPGLLARAHGGVLYVDEVNLLHDHLVDMLLDAAAMGRVHVERDGVSHTHDARFVLIGTMNPEEGELRPQLLDRFGLTVDVRASRDVDVRTEVIRARMDYEADPVAIRRPLHRGRGRHGPANRRGACPDRRCGVGRQRVTSDRGAVRGVRRRRDARGSGGGAHRRRARRLARVSDENPVNAEDIRVAAELALPHRRRRDPFDEPGLDPEVLDRALSNAADPEPDPTRPAGWRRRRSGCRRKRLRRKVIRATTASAPPPARPSAAPAPVFRTRALRVPGVGEGAPGRRSRARNRSGAVVGISPDDAGDGLHLFATLLSAAGRPIAAGGLRPVPDDVRRAIREGREGNLVVFVVDASGSMAARDRMSAVSGAALSLLRDAYQRRDQVAVITFRGGDASLLLPPTSSAHIAGRRLARFDTGGKTPLAAGLLAARDLVARQKVRDRSRRSLVVVLTDGRATGGPDPLGRARVAAARLIAEGATAVVVDCETSYIKLGLAGELAGWLGAPVLRLEQLRADHLSHAVRSVA